MMKNMGENLTKAEKYVHMRLNAGGYSLNHQQGNREHQLLKRCVNV
jgi:hypothetical protein